MNAPAAAQAGSRRLDVFVDGSFDAATRSGGWAFLVFDDERPLHAASGCERAASNNALEVLAAVKALSWITADAPGRDVTLWADSSHVVEGCQRYRAIWRNNGWKRIDPNQRARRRPIPDAVLWKQLDALLQTNPRVTVALCKGHAGNVGNEQADALARQAAGMAPLRATALGRSIARP